MPDTLRVWDPLVRVFHWSLVAGFAVAWITADELDRAHEVAGYAVAGLLAVRLVWGVVGARYARFAQFVKGPRATLAYLRDMAAGRERRHLGHNPAAAAMIVALILTLSATAFTGWLLVEPERLAGFPGQGWIAGPAHADDDKRRDEDRGEMVEDLHETFANLALALALLHVGGVALTSVRHRENLPRAMITGDKRAPGPDDIV